MELLTEKYAELLESKKAPALLESDRNMMALLLENADAESARLLAESGTVSGDIAQFTPIIMPLVRRVYPTLIANELLGVQPMTMPTGFIYSLTNKYTGDDGTKKVGQFGAQVLEISVENLADGTTVTGATSGATGTVIYSEDGKVLVTLGSAVKFSVETITEDIGEGVSTSTISGVYTNESTFKNIFKNYTGPINTAAGELLGKDMKEVGFEIAKKSVEAQTRKLKGQYTLEMYQDLKSQHGLMADEEIMSLMRAEMASEIDREVVDFVNTNATVTPNAFAPNSADGRWEIEKYRVEAIKIANESRQIGIDTKRGSGNILVVSPKVATMLEQIGSYTTAPVASGVNQPVSGGVAGTFDGKYKVVVDQYADSDYATVLYKGQDRRDAMGFFAPFIPLSFQKVTKEDTGQPAIIASTRYALDTTPVNPEAYARTFGIDFSGSALA
jgi:hypothetical protein